MDGWGELERGAMHWRNNGTEKPEAQAPRGEEGDGLWKETRRKQGGSGG